MKTIRKIITITIVLLTIQITKAQINAVTETGDEVILFDDGTWKYVNVHVSEEKEIPVSEKKYFKSDKSTFLVKSKALNMGIWINPKTWKFVKGTDNDDFEFQFHKKGDDLFAILITEKISIPIKTLKNIAIENARKVAPDLKVIKEEFRNVNGIQVLMMQMSGTIQGIKLTYYGYYYSNSKGAIQLLGFTGKNLFDNYKDDIEEFLNGLVEY